MIWVKIFITAVVAYFVGAGIVALSDANDIDSEAVFWVGAILCFLAIIAAIVSVLAGVWSML